MAKEQVTPELQQIITSTVVAAVTAMATELRKPPLPTQQQQADIERPKPSGPLLPQKSSSRRPTSVSCKNTPVPTNTHVLPAAARIVYGYKTTAFWAPRGSSFVCVVRGDLDR